MADQSVNDGFFVLCLDSMLATHLVYARRGQSKAGQRLGVKSKADRATMGVNANLRSGLDSHAIGEDANALKQLREATSWADLVPKPPLATFNTEVSKAYIQGISDTNNWSRRAKKRRRSELRVGLAEYLGLLARLERETTAGGAS